MQLRDIQSLFALVGASLLVTACEDKPDLPQDHGRRQAQLSEKLLARARRAAKDPKQQADAAKALAEVVVPALSPQLRLIAASDDQVIAAGAAKALVRILLVREPDDHAALVNCAKVESNDLVRAECVRVFGERATPADKAIFEAAIASSLVDVAHAAAAAITAHPTIWGQGPVPLNPVLSPAQLEPLQRAIDTQHGVSAPTPAPPGRDELESPDLEKKKEALRRALDVTDAVLLKTPGTDSALVHLLEDPDENVKLFVQALWLRRSLAAAPPPVDPAVK